MKCKSAAATTANQLTLSLNNAKKKQTANGLALIKHQTVSKLKLLLSAV